MKIGAVYPVIELEGDTDAIAKIALAVEDLGYDHLLMYDHVAGTRGEDRNPPLTAPSTETRPFHEPFVTFGYLAGITKRLELVTGVLILPQRQTVLVAKQAADVDLLSKGRLRLGVGSGWNYVEYDALGQDFALRGKRLTEQIEYMRRLWCEPLVSFAGQFDHMDRGNIVPRPKRQIPIYCGGLTEPALRRAAKLADGFIFISSTDEAISFWDHLQQLLKAAGRPVKGFGADYIVQEAGNGLEIQETVDAVRRWEDAGGTHVTIVSMGLGFRSAEEHISYFAEVKYKLGAS